ncbi:hypothetical protein ACFYKX_11245 [Cytobacillus sp. FJAT-54145]|uniref:Uncharacterized protein n=1 Tax=Cytobacillus spartinae TaxID=3299023 RepID=A0ABW6KAD1_9BACI
MNPYKRYQEILPSWELEDTGGHVLVFYKEVKTEDGQPILVSMSDDCVCYWQHKESGELVSLEQYKSNQVYYDEHGYDFQRVLLETGGSILVPNPLSVDTVRDLQNDFSTLQSEFQ